MHPARTSRLLAAALLFLALHGCATLDGPPNPDDPLERYNRSMYAFNEAADEYVMKPVAKGYNKVVPNALNKGITNFFSNLDDVVVLANNLLQAKFHDALSDSARIVWNTTFGLLGFIDVATEFGLEKHDEDFGQTLGSWGVGSGPYLVLPLLGPSTVRDASALPVDWFAFDPVFQDVDDNVNFGLLTLRFIDRRADLLTGSSILDTAAPDKYAFLRDFYLQRRRNLVNDGAPPEEFSDDEFLNEEELFQDEGLFNDEGLENELK